MLEYKITKIIDAGLYTKDGEKIMDLTGTYIPHLLGEIIINNKEKDEENIMQENIIYEQQSDMGSGYGEYIFSNITLRQALKWFEENLNDWGEITIQFKNGDILRKFDYDLYNNSQFYHHLNGWEYDFLVRKIEFRYCFMNRDIVIYLNK